MCVLVGARSRLILSHRTKKKITLTAEHGLRKTSFDFLPFFSSNAAANQTRFVALFVCKAGCCARENENQEAKMKSFVFFGSTITEKATVGEGDMHIRRLDGGSMEGVLFSSPRQNVVVCFRAHSEACWCICPSDRSVGWVETPCRLPKPKSCATYGLVYHCTPCCQPVAVRPPFRWSLLAVPLQQRHVGSIVRRG